MVLSLRNQNSFFTLCALCLCVLCGSPFTPTAVGNSATTVPAISPSDVAGHWEGAVALPGTPLAVRVDLSMVGIAWSGTIDIPQQNASGLPLSAVTVDGSSVRFVIRGVPGDPTFDGKLIGFKIAGTFTQGPLSLPFQLQRGHATSKPILPASTQESIAAKPYAEQEVAYSNGVIHLAGTLTIPSGNGPFPAVLLITGSGPQNRDEEILGHKPFLVMADYLARAGIAVLRADDRGVGGSTGGTVDEATTEELAGDSRAGIDFLKTQPGIDADRIGLIGHSEGAIIAPLLASRSRDIAFVVMLAGSGVRGDQVWMKQRELIEQADGFDAALIARENANAPKLISAIETGAGFAAIDNLERSLLDDQAQVLKQAQRPTTQETDGQAYEVTRAMTSRWFRFFLTYDPRPALAKVTVPMLVLNGDLDRQVSPEQNLPEIEKALKTAGNSDVTIRVMHGLNHLFQNAHTGSPSEYATIPQTFDEGTLKVICAWINDRFGRH